MDILGEFQSDFCENLAEFYQIFLKILAYLTDFSPQFMACMLCPYGGSSLVDLKCSRCTCTVCAVGQKVLY